MPRKSILLTAGLCMLMLFAGGCQSASNTVTQEKLPVNNYPDHPIHVIVPFSPGGGADLQARSLEKPALTYLKQPLTIVNRPGAGGVIGWNELVQAKPDGYTIGISSIDLILHSLYKKSEYHYITALDPIAQLSTSYSVLVVNADQPWHSLDELIHYAKEHPGELKFGSNGIGSLTHILGTVFAKTSDIQVGHVPFKGGSESTAALLGNHIHFVVLNPSVVKEQIKAGNLRALAVTGSKRINDPILGNIPTFKEQNLDIVLENWKGIAAPKILPKEEKKRLVAAFKSIANDPEFKQSMDKLGLEAAYLDPEESQKRWSEDSKRLEKWLKDTGILAQMQESKK